MTLSGKTELHVQDGNLGTVVVHCCACIAYIGNMQRPWQHAETLATCRDLSIMQRHTV